MIRRVVNPFDTLTARSTAQIESNALRLENRVAYPVLCVGP